MIPLTNKNDDELKSMYLASPMLDIKDNTYYWLFSNNFFNLIKITATSNKDFSYVDCMASLENEHSIKITDETSEKKLPLKERLNLKLFQHNQINLKVNDLAVISNISYPSIMLNLKFRRQAGKTFARAGKVLIGIDLNETNDMIYTETGNLLESFDMNEKQTIIVNGLPSTGKTILIKSLTENIIIRKFNGDKLLYEHLLHGIDLLEIFGNAIDGSNWNSSRYMRKIKFYFEKNKSMNKIVKVKIRHFLFEKERPLYFKQDGKKKFNFHIFHALLQGLYSILVVQKVNSDHDKFISSEYSSLLDKNLICSLYKQYHADICSTNGDVFQQFFQEKLLRFFQLAKEFKLSSKKVIKKILNILLSIIMLMHVEIEVDEEGKAFIDENNEMIILISNLIDCDPKLLKEKLISREIHSPRGSFYVVKFTPEEAIRARNNLVKFLYDHLYSFLTRVVNLSLSDLLQVKPTSDVDDNDSTIIMPVPSPKYIQLIECLGFENSSNSLENSLENLFINYTNDKLNNLLFDMLIKGEYELYKQEEILNESNFDCDFLKKVASTNISGSSSSSSSSSSLNKPRASIIKMNYNKNNGLLDIDIENTLQACDDNNKGIFKLLDVQSSLINTNKGAIKGLCDNIKLSWPQITTTSDSFFLVHFGSVVEYGADDFILKNVDSVYDELKEIASKFYKQLSKTFLIQKFDGNTDDKNMLNRCNAYLLKEINQDDNKAKATTNTNTNTSKARTSVGRRLSQNMKLKSNSEKFLTSLRKLIYKITYTKLSFIKLIKSIPSDKKHFDEKAVLQQLFSSGILESIILGKGGFFIRYNYQELMKRLAVFENFVNCQTKESFIQSLATILHIDINDFIIGKSLLFIKNHAIHVNNDLINCNNLPSFTILAILKHILKKLVNVVKVFLYFNHLGKKSRVKLFSNLFEEKIKSGKIKFAFNKIWTMAIEIFSCNKIIFAYRKYRVRKIDTLKKIKMDACKRIQTAYRRFREAKIENKKNAHKILNTCKRIQQVYRMFKDFQIKKKKETHKMRNACKRIKQAYRRFKDYQIEKKKKVHKEQNFCKIIQRAYGVFRDAQIEKKKEANKVQNACKRIQNTYRSFRDAQIETKKAAHKIMNACKRIQNTYRRFRDDQIAKKQAAHKIMNACKRIQKAYQRFRESQIEKKKKVHKEQNSCKRVQRTFRRYRDAQMVKKKEAHKVQNACKRIQKAYRRFRVYQIEKKKKIHKEQNSCKRVQRAYRRFRDAQIEKKKEAHKIINACKIIQNAYRRLREAQIEKKKKVHKEQNCCKIIQRAYRMLRDAQIQKKKGAHKVKNACKRIEKSYRRFRYAQIEKKKEAYKMMNKCKLIQKAYRRLRDSQIEKTKEVHANLNACKRIQKAYRRFRDAQIEKKKEAHKIINACKIIQKSYRRFKESQIEKKKKVHANLNACNRIQKAYRRFREAQIVKKKEAYKMMNKCKLIQKAYRRFRDAQREKKKEAYKMMNKCKLIQKSYRRFKESQIEKKKEAYKMMNKCKLIQKAYRRFREAQLVKKKEAYKMMNKCKLIHKAYRRFRDAQIVKKKEAYKMMNKCKLIQKAYRRFRDAQREKKKEAYKMMNKCKLIQKSYRRFKESQIEKKKKVHANLNACNRIQKAYRRFREAQIVKKKEAYKMMNKCKLIQKAYRRFRDAQREKKKEAYKMMNKCKLIQKSYRRFKESQIEKKKEAYKMMNKCKLIQKAYRRFREAQLVKKKEAYKMMNKCKLIHKAYRRFRDAQIVKKKEAYKMMNKCKLIQKAYRRFRNSQIEKRKKLHANLNACKIIQLAYRRYRAIQISKKIQAYKILNACKNIQKIYKRYRAEQRKIKKKNELALKIRRLYACRRIQKAYQYFTEKNRMRKFYCLLSHTLIHNLKRLFFIRLKMHQMMNDSAKFIQKVLRKYLQNKNRQLLRTFRSTLSRLSFMNFLREFIYHFNSLIFIQRNVKKFFERKQNLRIQFMSLFMHKYKKAILSDLKHAICLISTIKNNLKSAEKTNEMFTVNFSPVNVIDNYVTESPKKENSSNALAIDDQSIIKTSLTKNLNQTNLAQKWCRKTVCGYFKKPTSKTKLSKTTSSKMSNELSNILHTSSEKEIKEKKETIAKIKKATKHRVEELANLKKMDVFFDDCSAELNNLLQDMKMEMDKLQYNSNNVQEVDFRKLNNEAKKASTSMNMMITSSSSSSAHQHTHGNTPNESKYVNVQLKKLCMTDKLKK